ncbi:MAG: formate/nitrite transporter family protein [Eubacteriales bacterium]|nr:formate/nitrite transporter family protein [Eubacteriales bacterium]
MYNEDVNIICESAYKKNFIFKNNFLGYFILSILAGVYVGFGVLLAYSVGGSLHNDFVGYKLIMGICFSCALSFVYFAGAELFTGNTFVMSMGAVRKKITWADAIKVLIICYIGNLVGAILLSILTIASGILNSPEIGGFIAEYSQTKMTLEPLQILVRGMLCNMLVCLATWCGYRMKSESGKLIMIFWCILAFFTTGYEHSVANMTLLIIGTINPYETTNTFMGVLYNLSLATIGNIIGGVLFLAVPYLIIGKEIKKDKN